MKKIIITVTSLTLLSSCVGVETPVFNSTKPFVVGKIERISEGMCSYESINFTMCGSEFLAHKQKFIATQGVYSIGDTVIIKR